LKRKVSELDPIAAKVLIFAFNIPLSYFRASYADYFMQKRRAQTSLAQRAYRQRQEYAFLALQNQVDGLHDTVEKLNDCFLSLTDALTSSEWLKKDAQVASTLRKTIETFLDLVQSSEERCNDQEQRSQKGLSTSFSVGQLSENSTSKIPSVVDSAVVGPIRRFSSTTTRSLPSPPLALTDTFLTNPIQHPDGYTTTQVFKVNSTPSSARLHEQSSKMHQINPNHSQPAQLHLSFFPTAPWPAPHTGDMSFAKRLHRAAFQGGYRLANNAEQEFSDYQRVFKYTLSFHTNETLLLYLKKVVNENYERLFEGPEINPISHLIQSQFQGWINATEVSEYFSQRGFTFDGSLQYVDLEMDIPLANFDDSGLSGTYNMPLFQFPALDFARPRSRASEYSNTNFTGDANIFKANQNSFLRGHSVPSKTRTRVDVAKLIDGTSLQNYSFQLFGLLRNCRDCLAQSDNVSWSKSCFQERRVGLRSS
jgi:hypothetical protein